MNSIPNPVDSVQTTKTSVTIDGKTSDITTVLGTGGKKALVAGELADQFGLIVYASGYRNVAEAITGVGKVKGGEGKLFYRGISIEPLVEEASYPEVVYLLINGDLPNAQQLEAFERKMVQDIAGLPKEVAEMIKVMPRDGNAMVILQSAIAVLGISDKDVDSIKPIAQVPAMVAMIMRHKHGLDNFIEVDQTIGFVDNLERMMFADENGSYESHPVVNNYLHAHLTLHAEHGQNASTTTARTVSSSHATMAASISGATGSLSGPKHGKANQEVVETIDAIINDSEASGISLEDAIQKRIALATHEDKSQRKPLPGFGHAVYKSYDPRAAALKKIVDPLIQALDPGVLAPIVVKRLDVAKRLEEIALTDDYFIKKNLFPNVDFYSGIGLSALGIGVDEFTPMFEAGRVSGQVANVLERHKMDNPIHRPFGLNVEEEGRPFTPIDQRIGANGGPALDEHANENNGGMA